MSKLISISTFISLFCLSSISATATMLPIRPMKCEIVGTVRNKTTQNWVSINVQKLSCNDSQRQKQLVDDKEFEGQFPPQLSEVLSIGNKVKVKATVHVVVGGVISEAQIIKPTIFEKILRFIWKYNK